MSYFFTGTNKRLVGQLDTPLGYPVAIGMWMKFADHPVSTRCIVMLGTTLASIDGTLVLNTTSVDNQWEWKNRLDAANIREVGVIKTLDNVWFPFLGLSTHSTSRQCWVDSVASAIGPGLCDITGGLQHIIVGENLLNAQDVGGVVNVWLAELAIWNVVPTAEQIADYNAGRTAAEIAPSNLRLYCPLAGSSATQFNEGLDTGGDLTVTAATHSTDHPPIYSGAGGGGQAIRRAGGMAKARGRGQKGVNIFRERLAQTKSGLLVPAWSI